MSKETKKRIIKVFAAVSLVLIVPGFSVTTTALAVIPNWTQEFRLSCFPHDSPIEPTPAFIGGLKEKLER